MIKFEEHDGLIFKMLDKPVPLTKDAEVPCLVRFRMPFLERFKGKHEGVAFFCDAIKKNPLYGNRLYAYETRRVGCIAEPRELEIIGYPVADDSKEWALYQMMKGEKVTKGHLKHTYWHYDARPHLQCISEYICGTLQIMVSPEIWIKTADKDGWQIYHEPKPLLAEAKVGDLCQRRDGKYVQVDSYSNDRPCPVMCKSDIGGQDCFTLDGRNHNAVNNDKDIISTEPLATEETKEWALQMMKLGKCVCHVKAPSIKYHRPTHYIKRVVRENCTDDMSDAMWMEGADPTGWQIYEEPKQPKPKYSVGDWIQYAYPNNPEFDIEKDVLCNAARIVSVNGYEENVNIFIPSSMTYSYVSKKFITKVLSPSEVVIRIGRLSGRVEPVSINGIHIWFHLIDGNDRTIATIRISCLDTPTRELVESLLKAMRGES